MEQSAPPLGKGEHNGNTTPRLAQRKLRYNETCESIHVCVCVSVECLCV